MKRGAYIDKILPTFRPRDSSEREIQRWTGILLLKLEEITDIDTYTILDKRTYEDLQKVCKAMGNYNFIITHVPYNIHCENRENCSYPAYVSSLELIKTMHTEFPDTKIIVNTGAEPTVLRDEIILGYGAWRVMRKILADDESPESKIERMFNWVKEA